MLRVALAGLRHRRGRSLALLLTIAAATAAFAVLTGASQTQRLEVRGRVAANFRGAYDILVRGPAARDAVERREGLVRADVLTSGTRRVTRRQWRAIQRVPGVELAAPVAPLGYALVAVDIPVDLGAAVDGRGRAVARVRARFTADRGTTAVDEASSYAYVTPNALRAPVGMGDLSVPALFAPAERLAGGRTRSICQQDALVSAATSPWDRPARGTLSCWQRGGGGFVGQLPVGGAPRGFVTWRLPVLMAAVDPGSEARLDGLDEAVVAGRPLRRGAARADGPVPILASTVPFLDEQLHVRVERLPATAGVVAGSAAQVRRRLEALKGSRVLARRTVPAQRAWDRALRLGERVVFDTLWTLGPARVDRTGTVLRPRQVATDPASWSSSYQPSGLDQAPQTARDLAFRALQPHVAPNDARGTGRPAALRVVGRFDPRKLRGFGGSGTLQTFREPALAPADDATRRALGGRGLLPDGNLQGYATTTTPLLLTDLRDVRRFRGPNYPGLPTAAISAVRVRVAGVHGADAVSRERVRLAAQRIAQRTGLTVDVTLGASVAPQRLALPAGRFGRPPLVLQDAWARKGVGTAILSAVDRKSLVLFVLVLVVCGLFVANAVTAAARARQPELLLLRTLGWSTRRCAALLVGEVALLGAAAGLVGALAGWPAAALAGVGYPPERAALAALAAPALAILAALGPVAAVAGRPGSESAGRLRAARSPLSVRGLAVLDLRRGRVRTFLGGASVAIGVAALTLTLSAGFAFRDTLVGSVLGAAVALDVRTTDYVATGVLVALGLATVADVLFLDVRERAPELATLRATGWTDAAITRLVAYEGTLLGLAGGVAGAAAGLVGAALLADAAPARLLLVALVAVAVGAAAGAAAASAPIAWLRRQAVADGLQAP